MAKSSLKTADKRINNVDVKKYNVAGVDSDNNYYGRMEDLLNSSNTATTCLKTFVRFVTGEGATNKDFGSSIINRKGLTVDGLIRKMALSGGKFTGIALHVNYNGIGEVISVTPVEFSYCRKGINEEAGKIAVYNNWDYSKSKQIKKDDIVFYNSYAPHKVLQEVSQIELADKEKKELTPTEQKIRQWKEYGGQILWWTPNGEYPLVPYDSVSEDMQTEGNVKNTKRTASASNFMPSQILEVPAFEDVEETDDNGRVTIDDTERSNFFENIESFQGDDGVGSILVLEKDTPESEIKFHKVDIQNYDGIQKFTEESVKENIRENRQIPAALLTDKSISLSGDQIANAKEYYNDITSDDRKLISQLLEKVFYNFTREINSDGDYSITPLKSFDVISENADSIISIISNQNMTSDQKKQSLILIYGVSEEKANLLVSNPLNDNIND